MILHDEIRFYYGGYDQGATGADDTKLVSGIGLATLPRGRFAGISPVEHSNQQTLLAPVEHIGQITLKPLDFSQVTAIALNADARQGHIRVEVLTDRGLRIKGFTKEDAQPITGDALDHPVAWRQKTLADVGEGMYYQLLKVAVQLLVGVTAGIGAGTEPSSQQAQIEARVQAIILCLLQVLLGLYCLLSSAAGDRVEACVTTM